MIRKATVVSSHRRSVSLVPGLVLYLTDDDGNVLTDDAGDPLSIHDPAVHVRVVRLIGG